MTQGTYLHPEAIVTGEWLEAHLDDPSLRIFDCTFSLEYQGGDGDPFRVVTGRPEYEKAHIPGAGFLDLQADFSDLTSPYRFMLPAPEALAAAFARHGIGDNTRVILYGRANMQRAARFWWMLRWLGFDNAAVLDGGMDKWEADGRPVSSAPCTYAPTNGLTVRPRPDIFVGKDAVVSAMNDAGVCTVNALGEKLHSGEDDRYGRAGRIPGSVNVPAASLVNGDMTHLPADQAQRLFDAVGATPDKKVIVYCGGGIAASLDAFLLYQLGYENVAVYDASMSEWIADPALPMETD